MNIRQQKEMILFPLATVSIWSHEQNSALSKFGSSSQKKKDIFYDDRKLNAFN